MISRPEASTAMVRPPASSSIGNFCSPYRDTRSPPRLVEDIVSKLTRNEPDRIRFLSGSLSLNFWRLVLCPFRLLLPLFHFDLSQRLCHPVQYPVDNEPIFRAELRWRGRKRRRGLLSILHN